MKIKLLSIILVLCMLLTMLFACDRNNSQDTDTPTGDQTEAPTNDPTDAPSDNSTDDPIEKPSERPSEKPSEKPSEDSSEKPSEQPTEHVHTEVIDEAVPPTCIKTGLTEGKHCSVCNEIIIAQTEVAVTGHTWNGGYVCVVCGKDIPLTEGLEYTLTNNDTEYEVSGIGTATDTDIVIPKTYNSLPVTSIGESAFEDYTSLTSVTIPDGVTSIGYRAFRGCSSLTSITIPDSVTSIGYAAFHGCSSLTSISIPDSVTSISGSAFSGCSSLTSITIPDSVTSIGSYAFSCCSSLTSITIPDSVTSIDAWAFCDCSSLTSITFNGTKAEWKAISKGSSWNSSTPDYIVTCTDGTIAKDGTET